MTIESENIEISVDDPYGNSSKEATITIDGGAFKVKIGHLYNIFNGTIIDVT